MMNDYENEIAASTNLISASELPPDPLEGFNSEPPDIAPIREIDLGSAEYREFNRRNLEAKGGVWEHDDNGIIASIRFDGDIYYFSAVFANLGRGVFGMTDDAIIAQAWTDLTTVERILNQAQ